MKHQFRGGWVAQCQWQGLNTTVLSPAHRLCCLIGQQTLLGGRCTGNVEHENTANARVMHDSTIIPRWPPAIILDFSEPVIRSPNADSWPQKQTWRRSTNRLWSCGHFCISKMAVIRHHGFYGTAISAIRSADPENHKLESNTEWIGCIVCEIFAFKLYCDLEIGVHGHSWSSKAALFDRAHTTLYSSSTVTMPLSITVSEIYPHIGRKLLTPFYLAPPFGVKPPYLHKDPWWRKTRMMGLSDGERMLMMRSADLTQITRVTDGGTDGIGVAYTCYSIYAVTRKNAVT